MASGTEILLTLVMGGISIVLVRTILVIRNRRLRYAVEGGDDYVGDAKDPQALSKPDSDALEEMDKLLERAGFNMPEDE